MPLALYLINPASDAPGYYGAEVCRHIGLAPTATIADIVMTTVAAMAPDDFEISVCDENLQPVDFDTPARIVGLTAKSSQVARMLELAEEFRARGKIVMIGGPFASLSPETVRPYCDILVIGELEEIAPTLFADCLAGTWRSEYRGGQPDLRTSPIPRWELYPNDQAIAGCVQTSRGCPFACEFCDVIQYVGRKQRHKSVEQILAELDRLYEYGYTNVFLADDNFTAYRRRTRELLTAIRDWNAKKPDGRIRFSTQLSIDIARDEDILQLCAEAGLTNVFIGIETPNEEALKETHKRQNVGINMFREIERFVEYGIGVTGGMIVGFDSDGPDIFDRQYRFAMATPVPIYTVRALFAPEATPLHARMQKENRLLEVPKQKTHSMIGLWPSNILPRQMSPETLFSGLRWLANKLYEPNAFRERMMTFIKSYRLPSEAENKFRSTHRHVEGRVMMTLLDLCRMGDAERQLWKDVTEASAGNPSLRWNILSMLFQYRQIRHMYEQEHFWEPLLAAEPAPVEQTPPALVSLSV